MISHMIGEEELDHDDFKPFEFDEIWYDYNFHGYEGSGALLARRDDKFVLFDLGHCSCYGPMENVDLQGKVWEDFNELWSRLSEANRKCCKTVFEAAKKYKTITKEAA